LSLDHAQLACARDDQAALDITGQKCYYPVYGGRYQSSANKWSYPSPSLGGVSVYADKAVRVRNTRRCGWGGTSEGGETITMNEPWYGPNEIGEMPGDLCCQYAMNELCYVHDCANYMLVGGRWLPLYKIGDKIEIEMAHSESLVRLYDQSRCIERVRLLAETSTKECGDGNVELHV